MLRRPGAQTAGALRLLAAAAWPLPSSLALLASQNQGRMSPRLRPDLPGGGCTGAGTDPQPHPRWLRRAPTSGPDLSSEEERGGGHGQAGPQAARAARLCFRNVPGEPRRTRKPAAPAPDLQPPPAGLPLRAAQAWELLPASARALSCRCAPNGVAGLPRSERSEAASEKSPHEEALQLRETPGPGGPGLRPPRVRGPRVPHQGRGTAEDPQGGHQGRGRGGAAAWRAGAGTWMPATGRTGLLYIWPVRMAVWKCSLSC
ncbi:uncharacterized protein isoform X2 [Macaca fascicularis]|uniref:uncharacterized protein isoform X2 n=1 Tax=Macaca fascicularis TaxID=9541 RepID=UPI003D15BA83